MHKAVTELKCMKTCITPARLICMSHIRLMKSTF